MSMIEISVVPVGTGSPSVSAHVALAVEELKKSSGVKWKLTPMGTVIEGELEQLLALAQRMHRAVFAAGVKRVVTTIKIDDRIDRPLSMKGKVRAVKARLESRKKKAKKLSGK